jgi:hypothetical protein
MALRTDYVDTTPSAQEHPEAHNDVNAVVNVLEPRVTALEPRVTALETSVGGKIGPPGRWVWTWWPGVTFNSQSTVVGEMRCVRFQADQAFDALAVQQTTTPAGSSVKVGVYATNAQGYPTTLAASITLDTTTGGSFPPKQGTFTAVPAGLYWLAFLPLGAAPNMACSTATSALFVTQNTTPNISSAGGSWTVPGQANLPTPFPVASVSGGALQVPVAQMRLA